eukprot:m.1647304 g.1647304  ORF g.1647304 m.1647304 type:complete len:57 (-) comp74605_c0_seq1:79-249(-)
MESAMACRATQMVDGLSTAHVYETATHVYGTAHAITRDALCSCTLRDFSLSSQTVL